MIAGAQKAGTSSLVRYLAQHPQICTHQQREMTYFVNANEYASGYSTVFPHYFGYCESDQKRIVAKSVGVMYMQDALERLYSHNPDCHIVIILRNPIDRAYSAFWFARRRGWEPIANFEKAIMAGTDRFKDGSLEQRSCMYLERSTYVHYLPHILELFGRDQLHIFMLEEMKRNTTAVCQSIFELIEVDTDFEPQVLAHHNSAAAARSQRMARWLAAGRVQARFLRDLAPEWLRWQLRGLVVRVENMNERTVAPPAMDPETRRMLVDHFRPANEQLSELIGVDVSYWNA